MNHALVIGASHDRTPGQVSATDVDAERMTELLESRRFEVETLSQGNATRDAIRDGYLRLIRRVRSNDAAVVYFAGHGGRMIETLPPGQRALPRRFQFIAAADYGKTTDTDFRGLSAWELSELLRTLTTVTRNATVILDCCFAAQMSRDHAIARLEPRCVELTWLGIEREFHGVRARFGPDDRPVGASNPHAVRIAACGDWQTAYPTRTRDGRPTGILTNALIEILTEVGEAAVSWRTIVDTVRTRVNRASSIQWPIAEGPVDRQPFSMATVGRRMISIEPRGEVLHLDAGRFAGVSVGDIYGVTRVDATSCTATTSLLRVVVERVDPLSAVARRTGSPSSAACPDPATAWLVESALERYPIHLAVPEAGRTLVEAKLAASARLRLAAAGEPPFGELHARGSGYILGGEDQPPEALATVISRLDKLAAARTLCDLAGEHGLAESDIDIEWGTIHHGAQIPRAADGAALGLHDQIYLKFTNCCTGSRFVHVFNIGVRGTISRLSCDTPAGIQLDPKRVRAVGLGPERESREQGRDLIWPPRTSRHEPRIDTLAIIITTRAGDLGALETSAPPGSPPVTARSLQRLATQLFAGGTRSVSPATEDPFCVALRTYVLHPFAAPVASLGFALDDDPRASHPTAKPRAWLRGPPGTARSIELYLRELSTKSPVRIDALVCTRSAASGGVFHACTFRVGPRTGEHLLWRGPVTDLLDVYLWSGPATDDDDDGPLADHLAARVRNGELRDVMDALVIRDPEAPWSLAGGASSALARAAGELLRELAPKSAGLVHTRFDERDYGTARRRTTRRYRAHGIELRLAIQPA